MQKIKQIEDLLPQHSIGRRSLLQRIKISNGLDAYNLFAKRGKLSILLSMKKVLIWILMTGLAYASSARKCVNPTLTDFAGGSYTLQENIVYDGTKDLKGDLYLPVGKELAPAILFIHGGGWVGGSKGLLNSVAMGEYFACRGYAFFDVDYLLAPKENVVDQIKDVKCALRFLKGKAKEWNIDKQRIAVTGGSAGGHLSAMVALSANEEKLAPSCSAYPEEDVTVAAGVFWYGVFDFAPFADTIKEIGMLKTIFGHNPSSEELSLVSPITYAKEANLPPVLIIQGEKDSLVPVKQALALTEALAKQNHPVESLLVPNANHAFDAGVADPRTTSSFVAMDAFLRRVLNAE